MFFGVSAALAGCAPDAIPQPASSPVRPADSLTPYLSVTGPNILLENVSVYVGDGSPALLNHSILINDDKIIAVAPANEVKPPSGTARLNLEGQTVIPGFIGLHNHTHMPGIRLMKYTAPRLYLAGGVTTIQTTGSADSLGEIALAKEIAAQNVPGPTIFPTAPYITGPSGNAVMDKPETEQEAADFVEKWAKAGATWIKLYRHTDPKIAKTIIETAHAEGLKVTGHLCSITFEEAAKMGIDSIEHGLNASTDFVSDKPSGKCVGSRQSKLDLDINGPEVTSLIEVLVAENVTLTSTLAILETGFSHRPQAQPRALIAMAPNQIQYYETRQKELQNRASATTSTPEYWKKITDFERRFVAAGGHLVAGPDTGRHILPGFGDQRNFELLVEAGFSVPQAIQIMSHNGAETLRIGDSVGLIKVGYEADLIIVSGDLKTSPQSIRRASIIFKDGLGYDPALLLADVKGKVGLPQ